MPLTETELHEIRNLFVRLQDFVPIIPDEVLDRILEGAGCNTDDKIVKNLIALAAQKYMNDILSSCKEFQVARENELVKAKQQRDKSDKLDGMILVDLLKQFGIQVPFTMPHAKPAPDMGSNQRQ